MDIVSDEEGRILFNIEHVNLNKGDYIKRKDKQYIIKKKQYDFDINAIAYLVDLCEVIHE